MKLRQKLAVALATAMVVTSVPVVTMAASTSRVTKTVTVSDSDNVLGATAPKLEIELDDTVTSNSQFYISLEGSEFPKDLKTLETETAGVVVEVTSSTEATVKVNDDISDRISISLKGVKVTGEAKISIDGNETEVTSAGPFVFANQNTANATVTAKDATSFFTATAEKVGSIVITEEVAASLTGDDRTILIDMEHGDFDFVNASSVKFVGSKGFAGQDNEEGSSVAIENDGQTLRITLPKYSPAAGRGVIEIQGIEVRSTDKNPSLGDLNVTVSAAKDAKVETKEVTVATITEYGTEFTVEEKVEAVAGKTVDVKLTYKELTADSLPASDIEFVLSQGFVKESTLPKDSTPVLDKDDNIIGFTVSTKGASTIETILDGHTLTIQTELGMTGDIVIEATGRYVEDQEVVVATITEAFKVETEAMILKVGQTKQNGGKITLTETKAGDLKRGTVLTVDFDSIEGVTITGLPEVKATGGMEVKVTESKTTAGQIQIEVTKEAREEAGTITIEGIEVSVNRTTPEGKFDASIKLAGNNAFQGAIELKDFIIVGTPNTEDLAANGLAKGTSSFVIGESKYTVNGTVKEMDGASYIQNPGFTMVPVRYVAEAFGVSGRDILFSNGQATIFAGSRTIQLTNNSDVAVVNGVQIKMETKVVIKDGRTYAPIGEVAKLLGIDKAWDSTTKTATFINQ